MARQLAIKSLKLTQVVAENNNLRHKIEELKAKLSTTTPPPSATPAPPASQPMAPPPPRRLTTKELHLQDIIKHKNIKLEEANFDLVSQTALPHRDLPEGPVIFEIPRLIIPKRRAHG
ncbi:hypothetical protein ABPG75_000233 [Micractinium tetrahymenae]